MFRTSVYGLLATVACIVIASTLVSGTKAAESQIERGKYLVSVISCNDCHTPGALHGQPDMQRFLGGSDVGFAIPGQGVFVGRNLTPDKETGLGSWTTQQIVTALTTGKRPDGRILAPVMPWMSFSHLSKNDATAIAAYLKSLPPIKHAVPGPFGATQKPNVLVMAVISPDDYIKVQKSSVAAK